MEVAERLLVVSGAHKSFGALHAVNNVSFEVMRGEIFGIAGPNGSGKSTLFNIITGIPISADAGDIHLNGQSIRRVRGDQIARRGLARTFQKETDFASLSVLENVLIGASYGGSERSAADTRTTATEALSFVGIAAEEHARPVAGLSILHKKKMMIASAIAMRPQILLLDEPASGLTKPEVEVVKGLILKLNAQGMTILLIEHVLSLLLSVSHRIMVLSHGEVLAIGTPDEVVNDQTVVEAYLGSKK
jgi:branched-chain amino acid transport system ATP-binding protein